MSRIIPIPTSRVGDLFIRQRLIGQVQQDQLALFGLQNQISTGQRLQLPSDDAPAALRAIGVQRVLDRKSQIRTNLAASNSYLSVAWDRLGAVSGLLSDLRGTVVGVAGTVVPDSSRQAAIQEIDGVLRELVAAGNAKYQGRHLFAGSRSQDQPYDYRGDFVEYFGNDGTLRSYVDLERLFDTNLAGSEVFGGASSGVEGGDLNPHVSANTLLSTLNGGAGIGSNPAITVTVKKADNTTVASVVDLSKAVTLGDVARLIEASAPAGTSVTVEVTSNGLVLTGSGAIGVAEVGQGRTARQLGIASSAVGTTIVGGDLNPALLKTTRLGDLLGTKAQGRIDFDGANNGLVLTAGQNGAQFNGTVEFVGGGAAGAEVVTYDANANKLTVTIEKGVSTANQVAAAITAEGTFTAVADYHDATSTPQSGLGTIDFAGASSSVATTGGGGNVLDTASGLVLTNGGQSVTLDISDAATVEDLLNLINSQGLGLRAEINAAGTGIDVRSRLSGADFTIGENGGSTASQLGLRTYSGATELAALNRGLGVPTNTNAANDDLLITARDGTTQLSINLSTATTIQDVVDLINSHPNNAPLNAGDPPKVEARLALVGNGIELVDHTVGNGTDTLTVAALEGSLAAQYLGFVAEGATQSDPAAVQVDGSGNEVLASQDRHTLEVDSVFNTLMRLRTALQQNNTAEIGRALERLDTDLDRVNFARGELGTRLQNLEVIDARLQDEDVQLRGALSQDMDVDMVQAISELTARQYAFEASLRTTASMMQLSLLNFI